MMYHVKTLSDKKADVKRLVHLGTLGTYRRNVRSLHNKNEPCQEFRGQTVLQIEAVHNLRKVRMYLNVLSLRSTS